MNLFFSLLILSLLFINSPSFAKDGQHFFFKHVDDAYKINTERLPLYEKLSDGRSVKISKKLLFMEAVLIPIAKILDKKAIYFQEKGIPLFEKELVAMNLPPFQGRVENALQFIPLDISRLKKELKSSLENGDYKSLSEKANEYLNILENEKAAHCLVRHFLESIRRSANYAPTHLENAMARELKSPEKLINFFIKLHILGMNNAEKIDQLAFELQAEGLPIICQDVPNIPAW